MEVGGCTALLGSSVWMKLIFLPYLWSPRGFWSNATFTQCHCDTGDSSLPAPTHSMGQFLVFLLSVVRVSGILVSGEGSSVKRVFVYSVLGVCGALAFFFFSATTAAGF